MLNSRSIEYTTAPTLDADVFHCNLLGPRSVWYARRARRKDVPVVVHSHVTAEDFGDSFRFTNALSAPLRPYLSWAYSLADRIVCPSPYNQRLIQEYTDQPTTVISNGVDREKFRECESLRDAYRNRYDLDGLVVFLVGHVFKRKGLETFVELARRLPEITFVWFGPLELSFKGRETTRLIENSPENCRFTGYVDDIRGAYSAGDVFCFPTHEENEGIALLEAMAAGKPVVVRDIESFDWLEDGRDCLKVSDGVEGFETALRKLEQPRRRRTLGARAAERSAEFSLESLAERYESLYSELLDKKDNELLSESGSERLCENDSGVLNENDSEVPK